MSGNSNKGEGRRSGSDYAHLSFDLVKRFPVQDPTPEMTDNFIVHRVRDTGGHPYLIYQSVPRLSMQADLIEKIRENQKYASSVRDPNIHEKLEIISPTEPGHPFYLIESVDGDPLSGLIENEDLDEVRAMELIEGLLKALEPIHHAGLVYGSMDLDKIRIVRSEKGDHLRLGGLFRVSRPDSPVHLGFNPEFNAPDASAPRPAAADPAAPRTAKGALARPEPGKGETQWTASDDIYVVGMIAYRLLVGREAYRQALRTPLEASPENRAGAWEIQHKSIAGFPLPRSLKPQISPHFEDWVVSARNSDRSARFQDAHAAAEALRVAMDNVEKDRKGGWKLPGKVDSIVVPPRSQQDGVRRPLFAAFALVMLASAAVGGYLVWDGRRPDPAAVAAFRQELSATTEELSRAWPLAENLATDHPLRDGTRKAAALLKTISDTPLSRKNMDKLHGSLTLLHQGAVKTGDELETLVAKAKADQAAFATQLARLEALSPADDPDLAKDKELGASISSDLAAGAFDKVIAAAGRTGDLARSAGTLEAARSEAETARGTFQAAISDLGRKGIEALAADNPLRTGYAALGSTLATANAEFEARKWAASLAAIAGASPTISDLSSGLDAVISQASSLIEKAESDLAALVDVAPAGDTLLTGFRERIMAAKDAVARKSYDAAVALLAPLAAEMANASTAWLAARDAVQADIKAGQETVDRLAQIAPAEDAAVAASAQQLSAARDFAAQRNYARASELATSGLGQLSALESELVKARDEATAEREAYRKAQGDARTTVIERLSERSPMRRRSMSVDALVTEAEKAFGERRWKDATAGFRNASRTLQSLAAEIDATSSTIASQIELSRKRMDEINQLGGGRGDDLEDLRNSIADAEAALADNRLEAAGETIGTALKEVDELLQSLPADRQALELARTNLANARGALADKVAALSESNTIWQQFGQAEARLTELDKASGSTSLRESATAYAELTDVYRQLGAQLDALAASARQSVDALRDHLERLARLVADSDPSLAAFKDSLGDAAGKLNANAFDAAEAVASAAVKQIGPAMEEAQALSDKSTVERGRIADQVAKISAEFGDWTVGLPAFAPIGEGLKQIDDAVAARRHDQVASEAAGAAAAIAGWTAAIDAEKAKAEAAAKDAATARDAAVGVGGEATAAAKTGSSQMSDGAAAMAAKQFPAATAAFAQAAQSFGAAAAELKGNQDQVALVRASLSRQLEEARTVLPDDHALIAELAGAVDRQPSPKDDGSPVMLEQFKALEEKATPIISTMSRLKRQAEQALAGLNRRLEDIAAKGGRASGDFARVSDSVAEIAALIDKRKWDASLTAAGDVETSLTRLEKAAVDGAVISCPEGEGNRAMRQIPAGSFAISINTMAGRLAKDWAREAGAKGDATAIDIGLPFCIATAQVTVADFEEFVADAKHDTKVRDILITNANVKQSPANLVDLVSREDAEAYAAWLSKKSGLNYRLPSAQQMLAAAAYGAKAELPALTRGIGDPNREWTSDGCRGGSNAVVFGQIGGVENRVYAQCLQAAERVPRLGFRLVVLPKS